MSYASPGSRQLTAEKQALLALRKMRAHLEEVERARTEPIAIVGMGCRLPGGVHSPDDYWALLGAGRDAIGEVPADRWDVDAFFDPDPDAPGKMYTRHGAFLDAVDHFDASFFRIAPREAVSMDPQQRLLLEVTWEALEHGGFPPGALIGSETGVFIGISTSDYSQLLLQAAGHVHLDTYFGTGNAFNAAAGRLSYVLGLQGPCLAVDTACSSSLVAVHLACQSLRNRECQMALAGGVNLVLTPGNTVNFCRARMLAADGRCKTFDAAADGYVRGEGCGVIVLKRLSDAKADGNRILALVRGSAVNQDGRSGGFTAPNELAQQAVVAKALAAAGVRPEEIAYIEAHGTGTSLGDPIEIHALAAAFAGRPADRPLVVGSAKTNFGHLEAAAGIAGLMKTVLALQHREIPPHLHFKALNPHITVDGFPLVIPVSSRPWPGAAGSRLAGISSFGFSGTNAHVIVQEAPQEAAAAPAGLERPKHILALSAASEAALKQSAIRFAAHLEKSSAPVADVCFAANSGRSHFEHRLAVAGASADDLRAGLHGIVNGNPSGVAAQGKVSKSAQRQLVFLFTGQGSQYPGMGRELYDTQPVFRRVLERCNEALRSELERPLLSVMFPETDAAAAIDETAYAQPALFALEYALYELWRSWGIEPAAVAGHSIGEFAAACAAGVLTVEDALKLVAARGRLMQSLPLDGAMAAVSADARVVEAAIGSDHDRVSVAAVNAPDSTVLSGSRSAVAAVTARLLDRGVKSQALTVSHAFHSPLMDPMLDRFEEIAAAITYGEARIPFVSTLTGASITRESGIDAAYWRRHARRPVMFADAVRELVAHGYRSFLEIGPAPILVPLARRTVQNEDGLWLHSLRKGRSDWDEILATVAALYTNGVSVDWRGFDAAYSRRMVSVPAYAFQRERFWVDAPAAAPPSGFETVSSRSDSDPDQLLIAWRDAGEFAPRPHAVATRGVVLVDRDGESAAALAPRLRAAGADVITLTGDFDTAVLTIAWRDRAAAAGSIDDVVYLASSLKGLLDVDPLTIQRDCCGTLLALAGVLAAAGGASPRLWVVTRGSQSTTPDEEVDPGQAPAWGLGAAIASEHPEFRCTRVDLEPTTASLESLLSELLEGSDERCISHRNGRRLVPRLTRRERGSTAQPSLRADAAYVITGGLGALGLHTAQWLVSRGARRLVLTSRRPPTPAALDAIRRLERAGARVQVTAADISQASDVARLLDTAERDLGPIRGIVHAAGVLDDGILAQQNWERFARVLAPKVAGAWHLHQQTSTRELDFFVMFSSMASLLGSRGQASYAAANAFLDALAHARRKDGLPALSVNWGPWADGGMATAVDAAHRRHWEQSGLSLIPARAAVRALGELLGGSAAQVIVGSADWPRLVGDGGAAFIQELTASTHAGEPQITFKARLLSEPASRHAELIREHVQEEIEAVLGLTAGGARNERTLNELGVDSLMAMELRNRMQRALGVTVPITTFLDGMTVDRVATAVSTMLAAIPDRDESPEPRAVDAREAERLLERLDDLSEAEVDALLQTLAVDSTVRLN